MKSTTAADIDVGEVTAAGEASGTFSLELNQDQRDIGDWVHGFAEGVVPGRAP